MAAAVALLARRLSIGGIVLLGYLYFQISGGGTALAAIGLVSFAGVAQFLPALMGGILWRGATRMGALAGLGLGFVLWVWCLLLPSFGSGVVISEAVMAGLPVIASDIAGSVGLLGADYPGYYPVQNEGVLRERLLRAESDGGYYAELVGACAARRQLFTPQQEYAGWEELLDDIQSCAAV